MPFDNKNRTVLLRYIMYLCCFMLQDTVVLKSGMVSYFSDLRICKKRHFLVLSILFSLFLSCAIQNLKKSSSETKTFFFK